MHTECILSSLFQVSLAVDSPASTEKLHLRFPGDFLPFSDLSPERVETR